ncbi:hypothetical protein VD0004_g9510 [Verticillium dahliae]|nr:hypothetical protein VD0004_g9510 [Verticillium dahliae]PNH62196.1 hypothetical protein VD0001_g9516 [Verticillium dahliae]
MGLHKQTPKVAQGSPSPRRNPSRRLRHSTPPTEASRATRSKLTTQHLLRGDRDGAGEAQTFSTPQAGDEVLRPQEDPVRAVTAAATTHDTPETSWQRRSSLIGHGARNEHLKQQKPLVSKTKSKASTGPAWDSPLLTYYNWVAVMSYAAASDSPDGIDINWLLRTARSCSLLAEPALDVLYRCPPLTNDHKARSLVALLERPPSRTFYNYRAKIRALRIDTAFVTIQAHTPVSPFSLMQNLTNLEEVMIVHSSDDPPFRRRSENIRWQYPKELFEALDVAPDANVDAGDKRYVTHLKGFCWNARMMGRGFVDGVDKIKEIHAQPTFAYLRRVCFANFQVPSWNMRVTKQDESDEAIAAREAKDQKFSRSFAACLSGLDELEHLTFLSSSVVNAALLQNLPQKLKQLKVINCWDLQSIDLAEFLLSHGRHLESLVLDHNQALNLSFLTVLGTACPDLRELHMNLQYFRHYDAFDDSNPLYETLLYPDQIPTWPAALQRIELDNLRQWTVEAATNFFQSLVDSAPQLPMLRYLVVRCMLNIPWKSRSEFRHVWEPKLNAIFLRPKLSAPPVSSKTTNMRSKSTPPKKPRKGKRSSTEGPARQSRRIASKTSGQSSRASSASKPLRSIKRKQYEEPDSDEFDHEGDLDVDMDLSETEASEVGSNEGNSPAGASDGIFVQGLCTIVEIKLDNQKPRERQFVMEDFVDSERGDTDPEWDSQDDDFV